MYLLCEAWLQEPRATLPNDDKQLASMARVTPAIWDTVKEKVLDCFKPFKGNRIYNERLMEVSKLSETRSLSKKNKTKSKIQQNNNKVVPGSEPSLEEENEREREIEYVNEKEKEIVRDYEIHRKEMGKKIKSNKSLLKVVEKLRDLSNGDLDRMKKIVDNSIASGYQGIFALIDYKGKPRYGRQEVSDDKLKEQGRSFLERHSTENVE